MQLPNNSNLYIPSRAVNIHPELLVKFSVLTGRVCLTHAPLWSELLNPDCETWPQDTKDNVL